MRKQQQREAKGGGKQHACYLWHAAGPWGVWVRLETATRRRLCSITVHRGTPSASHDVAGAVKTHSDMNYTPNNTKDGMHTSCPYCQFRQEKKMLYRKKVFV